MVKNIVTYSNGKFWRPVITSVLNGHGVIKKKKLCILEFFTHIFVRLVYTHTSFLSVFLLKNMFSQILICGWIHLARTNHIYAKRQVSNCSRCKVYLSTDTGKQIPRDCVCLEIGVRRLRKQTKHFARNSGKNSFSSVGKRNSKCGEKASESASVCGKRFYE